MNMTRIKLILALALALACGYSASAQRNNRNFDRTQGNFNGDFGPGQRNNFGNRNNSGYYSSTQTTGVPGPTNYQSFSGFIAQRNIFNPARFAIVFGQSNRIAPPVRRNIPAFGLVGTMAYEKGMFAFFDGNSPEYQKVLYASDSNSIAGFIVADVTPSGVTLQTADKKQAMPLKIGDTLRQQDDGSWDFGGSSGAFSSAAGFGASSAASDFTSSPSTGPAAATPAAPSAAVQGNDILRRLMQERQQQLK